jgi:hypothetical protein
MRAFSRRVKVIFALFFVVGFGIFATWFVRYSNGSLEDFSGARLQGALIAQKIVDLSNESMTNLTRINELDRERNFTEALTMTTEVVKQSQEIRNLAVELSVEVEKMTKALTDIKSFEARQAALESISSRLALITRLISYSNHLSQLLDELRIRFATQTARGSTVKNLVDQINAEVNAINNFNRQAGEAMERFDRIVGN